MFKRGVLLKIRMETKENLKYEEEVLKNQRKKNKEDIKNGLNPLYSIAIGSLYECNEMLMDTEELIDAVALTNFNYGLKKAKEDFIKKINKLFKEEDNIISKAMEKINYLMVSRGITQEKERKELVKLRKDFLKSLGKRK